MTGLMAGLVSRSSVKKSASSAPWWEWTKLQ